MRVKKYDGPVKYLNYAVFVRVAVDTEQKKVLAAHVDLHTIHALAHQDKKTTKIAKDELLAGNWPDMEIL